MSNTTTCRHFVRVRMAPDGSLPDILRELRDPELFLADPALERGKILTLVFDVDATRALWLHAAWQGAVDGGRLNDEFGATLYWPQNHAAFTDNGWIDVEALEGEPMTRAHP